MRDLAAEERAEFAALLDTLSPEQWDAPTLCEDWRVRDVVAHVISYDELSVRGLLRRLAGGRFALPRVNALGVAEYATREPDELVALLREHQRPSGLPSAFGGRIALVDAMIHQQDIRRPLGLPRDIPARRLRPALSFAMLAPPLRALPRIRGLRLVATDLDWTWGRGPEVRGPGEALLLAAAGRHGVARELTGPGQPVLARRVDG
ncbi:maleylpyruvate isomerase family mycothiol-dependent enzyme [Prauserella muralis]|uniref:maleylpyruvate isomerase family mycothiol-dependent enzyme n=1 Tax=Prauserella muralis TaxID=588067 RepID=UPI0011ABCB79|nr:maleylpyruvate isomerase family mycothiol-dependent enzyme [Prauserella muralis]TWE22519.1 uncharacterized protein (TIGR03083 family) [Prauserella muralis]